MKRRRRRTWGNSSTIMNHKEKTPHYGRFQRCLVSHFLPGLFGFFHPLCVLPHSWMQSLYISIYTVNGVTVFFLDRFLTLIWFLSSSAVLPRSHTASLPDSERTDGAPLLPAACCKADVVWMDLSIVAVSYKPSLNGVVSGLDIISRLWLLS